MCTCKPRDLTIPVYTAALDAESDEVAGTLKNTRERELVKRDFDRLVDPEEDLYYWAMDYAPKGTKYVWLGSEIRRVRGRDVRVYFYYGKAATEAFDLRNAARAAEKEAERERERQAVRDREEQEARDAQAAKDRRWGWFRRLLPLAA